MAADVRKAETDDRMTVLTLPSDGGWLDAARQDALGRLQAVGLPGRRDEYWRYTNPAPFVQVSPARPSRGPEPTRSTASMLISSR